MLLLYEYFVRFFTAPDFRECFQPRSVGLIFCTIFQLSPTEICERYSNPRRKTERERIIILRKFSMSLKCSKRNKSIADSRVTDCLRYKSIKKSHASMQQGAEQSYPVCSWIVSKEAKLLKYMTDERLRMIEFLANKAIKEKKIFTIIGYYPEIRASLRKRGWAERIFPPLKDVEQQVDVGGASRRHVVKMWITKQLTKRENNSQDNQTDNGIVQLQEKEHFHYSLSDPDNIHCLVSKLIAKEIPYFIWTVRRNIIDCRSLHKHQMMNHYGRHASFTTKAGLCTNLRKLPSLLNENPDTFFPRCYLLSDENEERALCNDFRLTCAISVLKWVICNPASDKSNPSKGRMRLSEASRTGLGRHYNRVCRLSTDLIEMAIDVCEDFLQNQKLNGNDDKEEKPVTPSEELWEDLIEQHHCLIHHQATMPGSHHYLVRCQNLLNSLKSVYPQLEVEGIRNIWIIKPAAKSRGRGIKCVDSLGDLLELKAIDPSFVTSKWVVQKYIEKPRLIYDTKFDIRLWFLVTSWNPLTVWFYKDCYLRFSTQPFTLENLDSSIHLCNNAIQKKLKPAIERNPLIPTESMWSSDEFQDYLKIKGDDNIWKELIYPSMKKAIICSLITVQSNVEERKSNFGLYGADFLLGEDFKPWLIEINLSPSMARSTSVTSLLCANVQEDTIKVVIDRRYNSKCNTGQFECLSKQERKYFNKRTYALQEKRKQTSRKLHPMRRGKLWRARR
ncbi:protein monoglycylase TTLL8-like isoform X2 [Leucoraja erinacea]|uniref:protein monoglycylase TTLL8-like isoform X2 n=1 Tax=Leucoraja erinaceus TaxID=7782 RepID=UPI002457B9BB|nr:protein monoglycylase TTLL8-like isoform X2 [Leucoraja erinacea]